MVTQVEQRVCEILAARDADLRGDLARHVAIPTGHNHRQGLDEYRGHLLERLERLGATTIMVEGDPAPDWLGRPKEDIPATAVCRRLGPNESRPRALIAGHIDTVFPPGGAFRAMTVSPDGTTGVGPGVVDMKGGILIAVAALEALAEVGADLPWTFLLNSDEETGSFHSDRALRDEAARHEWGLAVEPALPDGSLAVERKGSGSFLVEAFGRSAHAGRDFFEGVSAVYALAHALIRLEGMSDRETGVTVNVGPLKGGEAANAVPDHAAAWGNVRYPTKELGEELDRKLAAVSSGAADLPRIVMHRTLNRPAKPLTPGTQTLADLARQTAEALGQQLPFSSTGGVCDGNILQDAGLPTIDTLGVRGGGLHTTREWIELRSLVERSQLFACLMLRLHGAHE